MTDVRRSAMRASEHRAKTLANPDAHVLAKARAARNLTQAELSALARVSVDVISAIESGRYGFVPNANTRARLATALALDEQELFS
jgi:transcriptional regulator with XRE-family HTH domain